MASCIINADDRDNDVGDDRDDDYFIAAVVAVGTSWKNNRENEDTIIFKKGKKGINLFKEFPFF